MRLATMLCLFLLTAMSPLHATVIDHLEPANWWIGMKHNRVELMVHGEGIAAATPKLQRAGVDVVDVQKTENPNYLFVTVEVAADAKPGAFDIEFVEGGKVVAKHPWRLDARAPGSAQRRGFDNRDAIYLITPDRFANADPRNDSVAGMKEAANRSDPNGRHGGDIAGIRKHLDYIAGLGFTQMWITPVLENNQPGFSYHGYAITDLYGTDPRFGSNDDYRALSNAGLWCLGRLQTDADRARVLDGLAAAQGSGEATADLANTLQRLAPRWFVVRNTHANSARY